MWFSTPALIIALTIAPAPPVSDQPVTPALFVQSSDDVRATDRDATASKPQTSSQQATAEEKKPPTPPHTGLRALFSGYIDDVKHLPSVPNMYLTLVGGAAATVAHPADATFNARLHSHYDLVNTAYAPAKYFGDTPEQVALSLGTYAAGRLFGAPKVSHLGMDLLRAQMLTETLVEPLKFAVHRERPDQSNHQSFPSGHSAITFAGATVLERHLGWKKSALAYLVAAYVGSSRLHDNRHYLSDVLFGAAVGTIAGRTVTLHGPTFWGLAPVSVPGGAAVVVYKVQK